MRSLDRRSVTRPVLVAALALGMASPSLAQRAAAPVFRPAVAEWRFLQSSPTPPTEAACYAAGLRCFAPAAMQQAYNVSPLYERGLTGKGKTIAVIDSFGSATIANDLNVFSTAFGLPHLCGEAGVTCAPGMPTFSILQIQGSPPPKPPPPSNGTGQESHNLWALEVSLDVEWAHAIAPEANILLVTTPTAVCDTNPGVRERAWPFAGGGYSILFPRPDFQATLPAGSSYVGSSVGAPGPNSEMRGVPDVAFQASSGTGPLVYMTEPATTASGTGCGGANPCSVGWYVVGGTSCSAPQWAGLIAIADQIAGSDLGYINAALYEVAADPTKYATDFFDVTIGNNQTTSIPGYPASTGWDAVTGLGTPNAAKLLPDLVEAASRP